MTATMPRPGSIVTVRSTPPPRSVPTDTGTWFVAGFTDRGPVTPQLIQSLSDFTRIYGGRQTYSVLYDAMETFFREGGSRAYVMRVVGPAVVPATFTGWAFKNLLDVGSGISLIARAKGPGTYGNTITVKVDNPGLGGTASSFSLTVVDTGYPGGTLTEQSPDFTSQAAAVAWSQQSQLIDIVLGATALLPVTLAASVLATGTDDRVNATDTQWLASLNRASRDLGPGQVSQVGRTTSQAYLDTLTHAAANNRTAILDAADTPTASTIQTAVATIRSSSVNARFGAMFAPWVVIPGLVSGTTRIVPPSCCVAGRLSANDGGGLSPNAPAAGLGAGQLRSAIGLSQAAFDSGSGVDVTRDAMYTAGVNQVVYRYGNFEVFGWRSLVDPNGADQDWVNLGNVRTSMFIVAKALAVAENYILDQIDGRGRLFKAFEGDLRGILLGLYATDALYGATPEDAFSVDVGAQVNTPTTIANRELHAAIAVRMSQDAEIVVIEIAKVPTNQSL